MVGNQYIINTQLALHEKNPIKDKIGDKEVIDIVGVITDEYWKEWRRQLTNSEKPYIYAPGIGVFSLMYGKSKSYLRSILSKMRNTKKFFPEAYLEEGTKPNSIYNTYYKRFKSTWKQVDVIKKEVVYKMELWKQKKIAKYGDKAIL